MRETAKELNSLLQQKCEIVGTFGLCDLSHNKKIAEASSISNFPKNRYNEAMKNLEKEIYNYLEERGWNKLRPSDLAKSISIEAAELLEIF